MSDELKNEEIKESKCFCQSKSFRKFLTIALGTFVGVYAALCLFTALHKPPMMPPQPFGPYGGMRNGCPCKMVHHHHFDKDHQRGNVKFNHIEKGQKQAPFDESSD